MKKLLFLIVGAIVASMNVKAYPGYVYGRITDLKSFPLPGASVFVRENTKIGTVTDINGFFRLEEVPEGEISVEARYIGYKNDVKIITVNSREGLELDFVLKEGLELEEIKINNRLWRQTRALNQQKNSIKITNVIAADQVDKFPDSNIGDALKRIPGINVQYDQGEARFGNIRGTSPDLNSVMINGERIPSAEAETRSIQLDLIPSDMIQTVEVSKVVTADMEGDAIGGSVNLVTRTKPHKRRVSGTVGSGYNFLSGKPMAIGSLVFGDRYLNDMLGVVFSGSYQNHRLGSDNIEAEWDKDGSMKDFQIRTYALQRERQSFSASFDLKANENHIFELKGIYNTRNDWENRYRLRFKDIEKNDDGGAKAEIRRQTKGGNKDTRYARLENQQTLSLSLVGEHHFGKLVAKWKGSYAKASEERPNERYLSMRLKNVAITPDVTNTEAPSISVDDNDADLNSTWGLKELTEEFQYTSDVDRSFKADFKLPFSLNDNRGKLKFGFKYKGKKKKRDNKFYEYEPEDEDGFVSNATGRLSDITKSNFLAGNYVAGKYVSRRFLGDLNLSGDDYKGEKNNEESAGNFNALENVYAGYIRWDQKVGRKLEIVGGVRYEYTGLEYDGFVFDDEEETLEPTGTNESSYANFLPGVLVKYDLGENTKVKAAWTNTMARPKYYYLVPYQIINKEDEKKYIGNSNLDATKSMNIDLIIEHYYKSIGLVSAGLYYKDIKGYIAEQKTEEEIGGTTWKVFKPVNVGDAKIHGFEASFQRQMDFLPGFLKRFGLYTNYSYNFSTVSNVKLDGRKDDDITFTGSPEHTLNASLFYEDKKLSLRASFNYASAFLDEYGSEAYKDRYYDKAMHLDLSGSYVIYKELRFFVEANNLLNTPLRYYQGKSHYTMQAEYYNMRVQGGIKFNF